MPTFEIHCFNTAMAQARRPAARLSAATFTIPPSFSFPRTMSANISLLIFAPAGFDSLIHRITLPQTLPQEYPARSIWKLRQMAVFTTCQSAQPQSSRFSSQASCRVSRRNHRIRRWCRDSQRHSRSRRVAVRRSAISGSATRSTSQARTRRATWLLRRLSLTTAQSFVV